MAITAEEAKRYSAAAGDGLTAERVDKERWKQRAIAAEAERDAALAQVEALRAVVRPLLISHCSNMHLSALCSLCRQANAALSSSGEKT